MPSTWTGPGVGLLCPHFGDEDFSLGELEGCAQGALAVYPRDPASSGAALGCPQQRLSLLLPGETCMVELLGCALNPLVLPPRAGWWSPLPRFRAAGGPLPCRAAAQPRVGWTVQLALWAARCVPGQVPSPRGPRFPWGPLATRGLCSSLPWPCSPELVALQLG